MTLPCRQVREQLSEYWGGELSPEARQAVATHLQSCPACQQEWGKFCEAMAALRSAAAPAPPSDLPARIHAAVALRHRSALWRRWLWTGVGVMSAAVMVMAILSRSVVRSPSVHIAHQQAPSPATLSSRPTSPPSPPARSLEAERRALTKPPSSPSQPPSPTAPKRSKGSPTPMLAMRRPVAPSSGAVPQPAPLTPNPQSPSPLPRQAMPTERTEAAAPSSAVPTISGAQAPDTSPALPRLARQRLRSDEAQRMGFVLEEGIKVTWERFEPPFLGTTAFWRLRLKPPVAGHLTLSVQGGDEVEVPNATPQLAPEGGLLLGEGVATPDKPMTLPVLVRPQKEGVLRLTFIATGAGRVDRWVALFSASAGQPPPPLSVDAGMPIGQDKWILQDLLTFLAHQIGGAFLVPEAALQQTIFLPTERVTVRDILNAVEKSLGCRWQQVDSAFALTTAGSRR